MTKSSGGHTMGFLNKKALSRQPREDPVEKGASKANPQITPEPSAQETREIKPPSILKMAEKESGGDPGKLTELVVEIYVAAEHQDWRRFIGHLANEAIGHCVGEWEKIHAELKAGRKVEMKKAELVARALHDAVVTAPAHRWQTLRGNAENLLIAVEKRDEKWLAPGPVADECIKQEEDVRFLFETDGSTRSGPDPNMIEAKRLNQQAFERISKSDPNNLPLPREIQETRKF